MQAVDYERQKNGQRLDFRGVNTVLPPELLEPGKYPFAQNVRRYLQGATIGRALQNAALFALAGNLVNSLRRLNDTTPAGPPAGFIIVSSAGADLYANGESVNSQLSGNRVSMVPFRPNASVQPWMYVADDDVMLKVRSDGTTFKQGIKEPQVPAFGVLSNFPQDALINPFEVLSEWTAVNSTLTEIQRVTPPATITAILFDYGTTGNASVILSANNAIVNTDLFANDNLNNPIFVAAELAAPPNTTVASIMYETGNTGYAWITLSNYENVAINQVYLLGTGGDQEYVRIQAVQNNSGQTLIYVFTVNTHTAGETLTGAISYRMNFPAGGAVGQALYDGAVELSTSGGANPIGISGNMTANLYFHAYHFAGQCELRNPVDGTNNPGVSPYVLYATFQNASVLFNPPTAPGGPSFPAGTDMQWAELNGLGNITGYIDMGPNSAIDYCMIVFGELVFPAAGNYTFQMNHVDGLYFGMDGGISLVSGPTVCPAPTPTLTALNGYPFIGANNISGANTDTWVINVPQAGTYHIEIDYAHWHHSGQKLVFTINGTNPVPNASLPNYGMFTFSPAVNQTLGNRLVQPTDLVHLLVAANNPSIITDITVTFNVDPTAQDFVTNAYQWTITGSQIPTANTVTDVSIPVQALTRIGQGQVSAINVTDGGENYTSVPTVVISGGGGTGAAGEAIVNGSGQVSGVIITNPGAGYAFAPAVSFTGGGGTSAAATALISGVNVALTMATGIYGVQINVTKGAGLLQLEFVNLVIVGQYGPTVLSNENEDLWYYTYFSNYTGAESNPSPPMRSGLAPASQAVVLTATPSSDPQVTAINWYRQGGSIQNATYVGQSPNSNQPFLDDLDDATIENNPQLSFQNYEPVPSIDLPQTAVVNVNGFTVTWVSGDQFNLRWLGGTDVLINGVAYTLYNRPQSATSFTILENGGIQGDVPLVIQEPTLAAQPMSSMWGPTDNVAFNFYCGDPLRPGTLYFSESNNPDAAPDTNQIEVTSPSEPLMNGCIVNGLSLVMSTERGFLAFPNFFSALATVTGIQGSPWTIQGSIADRGLYAKNGICSDGGNAYFIGKDGIYKSPGGNGSQSLTDKDLYNLFPHENTTPTNIELAGFTLYAPNFANPAGMSLSFSNGYLYFDYQDMNGNPRTLVYDVVNDAWVPDSYQFPVTVHETAEGETEGVYVGCSDGSVRLLAETGVENQTAIVLTTPYNAGEERAEKRFGDIYLEATVPENFSVSVMTYSNKYLTLVGGTAPNSLNSQDGLRAPYIVDFNAGQGLYSVDVELVLSWPLNSGTILFLWQPSLVPQPEGVQNRPTDWDDAGTPGAKFVQGFLLEADTFGNSKTFSVQIGDDLTEHEPNESPAVFNGQSIQPFSLTPPIIAHNMRLVATDFEQWRTWRISWIFQPYPELVAEWQTEMVSHGTMGWFHMREMNIPAIAPAPLLLTLLFDHWPSPVLVVIPSTNGVFVKQKVTLPAMKSKLVSYQLSSTAKFRLFLKDVEVKMKQWGSDGPYKVLKPFGGPTEEGALV
jgi:hypothetical protein